MNQLIEAALARAQQVRLQAHAPYSKFPVGAVLVADDGQRTERKGDHDGDHRRGAVAVLVLNFAQAEHDHGADESSER